jgi:hypothetical protein
MASADWIRLDSDEDGWELVVETGDGSHRFNVHGMASSGELDEALTRALRTLQEWREEGRAAAREYDLELARQESDDAYDRMVGDA